MEIEKAIEVLSDNETPPELRWDSEFVEAKQLSIEALKYIQRQSPNRALPGTELLPGETKD